MKIIIFFICTSLLVFQANGEADNPNGVPATKVAAAIGEYLFCAATGNNPTAVKIGAIVGTEVAELLAKDEKLNEGLLKNGSSMDVTQGVGDVAGKYVSREALVALKRATNVNVPDSDKIENVVGSVGSVLAAPFGLLVYVVGQVLDKDV